MNINFLVQYLRSSVLESDSGILNDKEYNPSDENLLNILRVSLAKLNPNLDIETIEEIDNNLIEGLILYSKKELFFRLASKSAPLYDFHTSEHKVLKEQRFIHYINLISTLDKEIEFFLNSGGANYITAGDVLINTRYYSKRNYDLSLEPRIILKIDLIEDNFVNLSWVISRVNLFACFELYLLEGEGEIYDKYSNEINKKAVLLEKIYDKKRLFYRVNIEKDKNYTIGIKIVERNGLFSFSEQVIKAKEVIEDEFN